MFPESRENGGPQTTTPRIGDWNCGWVETRKLKRYAEDWERTRRRNGESEGKNGDAGEKRGEEGETAKGELMPARKNAGEERKGRAEDRTYTERDPA